MAPPMYAASSNVPNTPVRGTRKSSSERISTTPMRRYVPAGMPTAAAVSMALGSYTSLR